MYHIFISYSRRDLDQARRIVNALEERKLDTWLDWDSIPKGEEWEEEIYRGIEEADVFLFLISPDSIKSEMCNKEIIWAISNNKRILPILLRETGNEKFRNQTAGLKINSLNWVFCRRDQDDFAEAITHIQETVRTDYDWVRFHTMLQIKALEWERSGKDGSRLLRGKELKEAEAEIAQAHGIEPLLTEIQDHFVRASRRAAENLRKRPMRIAGWITIILAIFIILSDKTWYRFVNIKPGPSAVTQLIVEITGADALPEETTLLLAGAIDKEYVILAEEADLTEAGDVLFVEFTNSTRGKVAVRLVLPDTPAYQLDFLPEVRSFESEEVSYEEAARLVEGAIAYSAGRYLDAITALNGTTSLSGETLLAQAYLFESKFDESRVSYDRALVLAGASGKDSSRLHMGAAYAWWGILDALSGSAIGESELDACDRAFEQYALVPPTAANRAWLSNLRIIASLELFCNNGQFQKEEPIIAWENERVTQEDGIGYLIAALGLSPDNPDEMDRHFQYLIRSAEQINLARYYLSRYHWSYQNDCAEARRSRDELGEFKISQSDLDYYRSLLQRLPLFCFN